MNLRSQLAKIPYDWLRATRAQYWLGARPFQTVSVVVTEHKPRFESPELLSIVFHMHTVTKYLE